MLDEDACGVHNEKTKFHSKNILKLYRVSQLKYVSLNSFRYAHAMTTVIFRNYSVTYVSFKLL